MTVVLSSSTCKGRLFHRLGATTENALSPVVVELKDTKLTIYTIDLLKQGDLQIQQYFIVFCFCCVFFRRAPPRQCHFDALPVRVKSNLIKFVPQEGESYIFVHIHNT